MEPLILCCVVIVATMIVSSEQRLLPRQHAITYANISNDLNPYWLSMQLTHSHCPCRTSYMILHSTTPPARAPGSHKLVCCSASCLLLLAGALS
jgi:hypothetical protein